MFLKYASWAMVLLSAVGSGTYFSVYDRMTRSPLRVLWVESPYATDLRNILDEFTDVTNISVRVESVPRSVYRESISRDLDRNASLHDVVIGESRWLPRDVSRGYYRDITPLVRNSWMFKVYEPNTDGEVFAPQPPGSHMYYAMPVIADSVGIAYRDNLFTNESNKQDFLSRYGYDLLIPETWDQLQDVAEFFYENRGLGVAFSYNAEDGALTETFLSLLIAHTRAFNEDNMSSMMRYIVSDDAERLLALLKRLFEFRSNNDEKNAATDYDPTRSFVDGNASLLIQRNERLREIESTMTDIRIAPVPQSEDSVASYGIIYGASIVSGTPNERAAEKLIQWLGTRVATEFMYDENGSILMNVMKSRSTTTRAHKNFMGGRHKLYKTFFTHPNAEMMLRVSDFYLRAYIAGKTDFSAHETLTTISDAWNKVLQE